MFDVAISTIALNKLTNKVDNMAIIFIKTAILFSNIERNILFIYKKLYDNYQYHILLKKAKILNLVYVTLQINFNI